MSDLRPLRRFAEAFGRRSRPDGVESHFCDSTRLFELQAIQDPVGEILYQRAGFWTKVGKRIDVPSGAAKVNLSNYAEAFTALRRLALEVKAGRTLAEAGAGPVACTGLLEQEQKYAGWRQLLDCCARGAVGIRASLSDWERADNEQLAGREEPGERSLVDSPAGWVADRHAA